MFARSRNSPASALTPTNVPPARKPRSQRRRTQGKSLLDALHAAGIAASNAKKQRNGVHIVYFSAPNVSDLDSPGTDPAKVWARRIENALTDVEVVDTYESRADWRQGNPVLWAQVYVRIRQTKSA